MLGDDRGVNRGLACCIPEPCLEHVDPTTCFFYSQSHCDCFAVVFVPLLGLTLQTLVDTLWIRAAE